MTAKLFIQSAIKHKGALRRKALRDGAITQRGTISKTWLKHKAATGTLTTRRQARLALTLSELRTHKRRKK